MRAAGERFAGPVVAAAAGGVAFCAVFFGGGFADAPLVWIGGLALALAAALAAAVLLGALPAPALDGPAAAFLGCLVGLAVWMGLSTLWSTSPERTWGYTNRTLVYAAFALAGFLAAPLLRRPASSLATGAALLLGLVFGWALLARCVPALYPDYGRVARLRSPLGYWNELALLAAVAAPLSLRLAAGRARRAGARAAGVLLLYAATVAVLLTYSRFGVALACLAAAAWTLLDRDRVESLAALALGGGAGAAVFGIAFALPGITSDGEPRSVRAHDGWVFALVLLAGAALAAGAAYGLARLEQRRPLSPERRRRVERTAGIAAAALALAGLAVSIVFAGRIWSEFTNPVTSQLEQGPQRLTSASSSNRWRWWQEAWHAFTRHPGGGTGAGTFQLTDLLLRRSPLTTEEPHNVPLQLLSETGIVGFLLYLGTVGAALWGIARRRRDPAALALGIGVAAFFAHTIVDFDWNFVATCGPLLLLAGALLGRPAAAPAVARRPLLAVGAVLFAAAAVYSLAAPWLAQRTLATAATAADVKRAHGYDPLSTDVLTEWAAFEDAGGNVLHALQLYRDAVSLEPQNAETWYALGAFYFDHKVWMNAYDALNNSYTYDRFGPASGRCGLLDRARWNAGFRFGPRCPGSG